MRMRWPRSTVCDACRSCVVVAIAAAVLITAGCYEHTIRREGWGQPNEPVYKPNVAQPGDEERQPPTRRGTESGFIRD